YGDGWMIRVKLSNIEEFDDLLMSAEEYEEYVEAEGGH
ncbi:MAG: Glycine cleavage H-protein, partial [Acidobacteria bacterium]|nr:Glycine cleavage H-protein [Acidobacteriota bacterium]